MDKFERLFFHLREEIKGYREAGINCQELWLVIDYVRVAEKAYKDFKKKTGILGIHKGGVPRG